MRSKRLVTVSRQTLEKLHMGVILASVRPSHELAWVPYAASKVVGKQLIAAKRHTYTQFASCRKHVVRNARLTRDLEVERMNMNEHDVDERAC